MQHGQQSACHGAAPMQLLSAAHAGLRADPAYLNLLEAESTWALKYNLTRTNPCTPMAHPVRGLNQPGMGPSQVEVFNRLLPQHFRVAHRASQNRLHTELFGPAPYTALGRGLVHHVDASNRLRYAESMHERGSKVHTMERQLNRFDAVELPQELRRLPFDSRMGAATRMGPEYLQPHDD